MPKGFDFMKRSTELLEEGRTVEEIVEITDKESSEADYHVLDDGAWFGLADEWAAEAERKYQESLQSA